MLRTAVLGAICQAMVATVLGCMEWEPPGPRAPFTVVSTSLDEAGGAVSPTEPIAVEFSAEPDAIEGEAFMLVRGAADPAFLSDAENPPLTAARQARLADGRVVTSGRVARFVPARPLAPEAVHTLVVTTRVRADGRRLARSLLRTFTTGGARDGAPLATLIAPADGESGVVRNLRAVEVRFSRPVLGVSPASLRLEGTAGPIAATVEGAGCPGCYRLTPGAALAAGATYRLVTGDGIVDDGGQAPFAWGHPPAFTTGEQLREQAPAIEQIVTSSASGCLVARWVTDVPASSVIELDGVVTEDRSLGLVHEIGRPIWPGREARFTIRSRDPSTAPPAVAGPLAIPASSPRPLLITEVLTRPLGPSPGQQFVEIWNHGEEPEPLGGLLLHDEGGESALPDVDLPPGGYALVVPSIFQLEGGADPAPDAAAVIARVSTAYLGRSGLRSTGESVLLVDPDGRPVSRFSTYGVPLERGQSARRAGPCDVAGAYTPTPGGRSTPGWP